MCANIINSTNIFTYILFISVSYKIHLLKINSYIKLIMNETKYDIGFKKSILLLFHPFHFQLKLKASNKKKNYFQFTLKYHKYTYICKQLYGCSHVFQDKKNK